MNPDFDQLRAVIAAYADAFNRGDLDGVCRLFAPDAQIFGVLGRGGVEQAKPIWTQLMACFGMQLRVEGIVAEGSTVAVRYTESGTFSQPFRGVAPTGKSYEVVAMEWFVFRDTLIFQRWGARDSATIFRQLGIPLT